MGPVSACDFCTKAGLEEEKMREREKEREREKGREGKGRMGREGNRQRRDPGFLNDELTGRRLEQGSRKGPVGRERLMTRKEAETVLAVSPSEAGMG